MRAEECEVGRIVQSTQGRDKGRYFVILAKNPLEQAFVADGKTHKVEKPKKKNIKHIKAKPHWLEEIAAKIEKNILIENHEIRKGLEEKGYMIKPKTNEEECTIVQK